MHLQRVSFQPDRYPTREHYPFNLDIFHKTAGLDFRTPVTLFVGENGTGKSTLLEAIARRCGIFIWQEGGRTLLTQSHGQSIMSFFKARYAIKGLYLLDELETALSPKTQIALLDLLERMSAAGHAQFLVATHSPILLSCPVATIYSFDHSPIASIPYQETEHYKIYRAFMGTEAGTDRLQLPEK